MSELMIDQSLSQKRIGLRQEQSLQILQKDFVALSADIQEAETENPFLDVKRQKDMAEFEFVRYKNNTSGGSAPRDGKDISSLAQRQETSLYQHLSEQISLMGLNKKTARIARRLVDGIDSSGYYLEPIADVVEELGVDVADVESVLVRVVQELEPRGVGARNISECLLLQLTNDEKSDTLLVGIISKELVLVAQNKLGRIAKKYGAALDDVRKRCNRLRQLSPKPGGTFTSDVVRYVFPDIIVERCDGQMTARLTEQQMMDVSVNTAYAERMLSKGDDKTREYVKKKARQAEWICQCIRRRRETLQNIANHIIRHQAAFFESGYGYLSPMTMKRMAADIGVHESTVSRGVSGKYLQCRWGVFALKFFFSGSVNGVSAEAVKQRIIDIIAEEPKTHPLSDQCIANMLRAEVGDIARRTVAKYRCACRIPNAAQRRQH